MKHRRVFFPVIAYDLIEFKFFGFILDPLHVFVLSTETVTANSKSLG